MRGRARAGGSAAGIRGAAAAKPSVAWRTERGHRRGGRRPVGEQGAGV